MSRLGDGHNVNISAMAAMAAMTTINCSSETLTRFKQFRVQFQAMRSNEVAYDAVLNYLLDLGEKEIARSEWYLKTEQGLELKRTPTSSR